MASEPPVRGRRASAEPALAPSDSSLNSSSSSPLSSSDAPSSDRRSWLSHGLAALAISGLGLAAAASMALTTNAQPTTVQQVVPANGTVTAGKLVPGAAQAPKVAATTASGPLAAFDQRAAAAEQTSRDDVRVAVVNERAAQRSEDLSKSSEEVSRAVLNQNSKARGKDLAASDRATQQQALANAQERLREAIAARVAAESTRQQAEADTTNLSTVDDSAIPTGDGSSSPVPGAVIGAHFGQYGVWSRYHTGLDFRASYGTPIRAVTSGIVIYAGNSGDWAGNHIAIRHAGGYTSMSSHMSSMAVQAGQTVHAGQIIGYVGQTGRAFGAHLHFEIYPPGVKYGDVYKAIDPVPWLSRQGVQTR